MRRRVRSLQSKLATTEAAGATLFGEPRLEQVLGTLHGSPVLVVPLFLARGLTYSNLQDRLSRVAGSERIVLCPEIGSHPALAGAVAAQALATLESQGWGAGETGIVLVGHGTRRHDASHRAIRRLAAEIAAMHRFADSAVAFLEEAPSVGDAVAAIEAEHVLAVGCFAEAGRHAMADVPEELARIDRTALYAGPICTQSWIEPLILDQALEGLRRFTREVETVGRPACAIGRL